MADNGSDLFHADWLRWFEALKTQVETPVTINAEQVGGGVFAPARIPPLPFTRITLDGSPRLLGRTSAGAGPSEEITVSGGLTLTLGRLSLTPVVTTAPIVTGAPMPTLSQDDGTEEARWAMAATMTRAVTGDRGLTGASGMDGRDADSGDDPWACAAAMTREVPFTPGSVLFAGPSGMYAQDNANLFYDAVNRRFGVRTASPLHALQVGATADATSNLVRITIDGGTAAASPVLSLFRAGATEGFITYSPSSGNNKMLFGNDSAGFTSAALLAASTVAFDFTNGRFGVGNTSPSAVLHLKAGAATAGSGPLKLTSGTNLTTAEAGVVEYNGTNLFFTRAGTVRENVLVAIDNVTAPTTTAGVAITNFYGSSATNFLGTPNRWLSVNVLGSTYKIPLYT